ncbi:1-acyl-sn-glycerol-3-phosphate acyltransferase [Phaeobacter sp.]|uniref:1-acyl-sn-glycerol-3-phosphate acyltransferase n=1 Tax=Phaeobacter sp. TaxID=1902409 RepID=UPI0025D1F94C|nr:1-acyl-sn-glycerol-3-phosphate acyltransferase [Phaeobacter sp.]
MMQTVELPLWLFLLIVLFAAVTFASHFLFPSVRWFFRRRLERAVERLNRRLERPIRPFKLARRYDMIQRLIYDPAVTKAMAAHAKASGIPDNVAFEEARRYAREIVPSFSAVAYFSIAIRLARFLSNTLYRVQLGYRDRPALAQIDPEATVVYVMNHRSNMDYVLITYLAADHSALSYAVGEWARVWPLSRLIRAMGAYFIRRKSRNDLYRQVLSTYVRLATQNGVTQAIFPEGGLSLTGALQDPKVGLIKYIVDGYLATDRTDELQRDVVFVPVAVNYDRVLEDQILTQAAGEGQRKFRPRISVIALRFFYQVWLWITGRYRGVGQAAVSFGTPLSLQSILAGTEDEADDPTELGLELMARIGEAVPILPAPMVALLLDELTVGGDTPITVAQLEERVSAKLADLPTQHGLSADDRLSEMITQGVDRLKARGIITQDDRGLHVAPDQRILLAYYANSIRHLWPDKAR